MNALVVLDELYRDMPTLSLKILISREVEARLCALSLGSPIFDKVKESEVGDEHLDKIMEKREQGKKVDFKVHDDGSGGSRFESCGFGVLENST